METIQGADGGNRNERVSASDDVAVALGGLVCVGTAVSFGWCQECLEL